MSNIIFRQAASMKPSSTSVMLMRVAQMAEQGISVISMNVGEPDFDTPEHIKEAGIQAIRENQTRYTPVIDDTASAGHRRKDGQGEPDPV